MVKTEVVCCAKGCGKHLRWIDTPYGGVSSGYCKKHYKEAMRKLDDWIQSSALSILVGIDKVDKYFRQEKENCLLTND